jgi:putative restriction endonuclease
MMSQEDVLARYVRKFSKLKTDAKSYWPKTSRHRAPYKPLLLLSILDLISFGPLKTNFIEFNVELFDIFERYWTVVVGPERKSNILMPIGHLRREGFWHLLPRPGQEQVLGHLKQFKSHKQLLDFVLGAQLDDELFELLLTPANVEELRKVLIFTHFLPEIHGALWEASKVSADSYEYSNLLSDRTRARFRLEEVPEVNERYQVEVRSVAFRRVVTGAYDHTCAMCGIRIITPEGRTAVEAAHIVRWSVSHNDDPRNGMALCRLHHWIFDQGLVSVSSRYQIQVSPLVEPEPGAEPVHKLHEQPVVLPKEQQLWPAKQALAWHRKNVFREDTPARLL